MNVQPVSNAMRTPSWKRVIDMCCCLVVSPLLALLTHVMTILATLVSPGLVLFRQERVGYQGRRFMCYKFRTMVVGADTRLHQQYFANLIGTKAPMGKIESRGDSRSIMGGRFLRASGLDDLPQIIDVFRGDMSIVGPRPCIPYECNHYSRDSANGSTPCLA